MVYVYLIIIGLPCMMVYIFAGKLVKAKATERNSLQTEAVVTGVKQTGSSADSFDSVILEYQDDDGNYHSARISTVPGQYKPGDVLPLKYEKDKPSQYNIQGMKQGHWALLVFSILILAFMIFASFKLNEMTEGTNFHFSP